MTLEHEAPIHITSDRVDVPGDHAGVDKARKRVRQIISAGLGEPEDGVYPLGGGFDHDGHFTGREFEIDRWKSNTNKTD